MTIDIKKALDESEVGGVGGGVLIPEKISPDIRDVLDTSAPLRVLLRRVPWSTNSYEWNDRTALMHGGFYQASDTFGKYLGVDKTDHSTYERKSKLIYRLKAEGNIDNLLKKASASFVDAAKIEVEAATVKMRLVEEDAFLRAVVPSAEAGNAFAPLYQLITQNVNANGAIMSFDLVDELISTVENQGFNVNLIVMAPRDMAKLRKEVRDKTHVAMGTMKVGNLDYEIDTYNKKMIITSSKVPTNLTYGGTPTDNMSVCYALNTDLIRVPVLEDVTYEEVSVSTDSLAFRLKEYITLVVIGGAIAHAKLINIGAS